MVRMKKLFIVIMNCLLPIFAFCKDWCELHFDKYEKHFSMPEKMLHAIALTESGKTIPKKGIIAWPWSINVSGQGYVFPTKEKAVLAARFLQKSGIQSFDVGCMQINLFHHSDAFQSLDEAFDPKSNVQYAAKFLKSLYEKNKNWKTAAGHYHNVKHTFYVPYQKKVMKYMDQLSAEKLKGFIPSHQDAHQLYETLENCFLESNQIFEFEDRVLLKDQKPKTPVPILIKPVFSNNFSHLNNLQINEKKKTPSNINRVHVNNTRYYPLQGTYKKIPPQAPMMFGRGGIRR